jgi:Response regulators consisting of a CheY-like receiver domain and a winged-helix DNA-binding domain
MLAANRWNRPAGVQGAEPTERERCASKCDAHQNWFPRAPAAAVSLDSIRRYWDIDALSQRRHIRSVARSGIIAMVENMAAGGELAGLRVMVIDDSKTIRRTAETLLKREGCEVVTATDGFEALAKIADQQPQIIFVDIMMPRLDGYQTCALIKRNQLFKSTPVIMLSSKDGLFDKARGRIVGSEQYLTKPFTREELLGAIRTYVNA